MLQSTWRKFNVGCYNYYKGNHNKIWQANCWTNLKKLVRQQSETSWNVCPRDIKILKSPIPFNSWPIIKTTKYQWNDLLFMPELLSTNALKNLNQNKSALPSTQSHWLSWELTIQTADLNMSKTMYRVSSAHLKKNMCVSKLEKIPGHSVGPLWVWKSKSPWSQIIFFFNKNYCKIKPKMITVYSNQKRDISSLTSTNPCLKTLIKRCFPTWI